jgi:hypothetical protein
MKPSDFDWQNMGGGLFELKSRKREIRKKN